MFIFAFTAVLLIACNKDDEGSGEAEILDFLVIATDVFTPQQVSLEKNSNQIHIFSNAYIEDANFPLSLTTNVEVSPGASVTPVSGSVVDFNGREEFVQYSTKSENGSTTMNWIAIVRDNQIPNSDFENWYQNTGMSGKPFFDPGKYLESTVWATANMGTSLYGVYGTTSIQNGENTMVKISTGKTSLIPVTSGTLFLGKFDLEGAIQNPTDPKKATDFNTLFTYRPTGIKFKYKYKAGDTLIQGTLKDPGNLFGGFTIEELSNKDEYSIYGTLEVREGETIKVIAEFDLRGSDTEDILSEKILTYEYSSSETPTHITLVFASSADGHLWKGAVGSTLIIDDLELVYE